MDWGIEGNNIIPEGAEVRYLAKYLERKIFMKYLLGFSEHYVDFISHIL